MAARRAPVLLGRAAERQALDGLLENVRDGRSEVLVIRGEAGVGKTALLYYCARQASPCWRELSRADSTTASATGSSLRPVAIRSLFWSCRGA
jgi:hypothetical protein